MSKSADLIVKGWLVGGNHSTISLRVEETIKGPVREQWTLQYPEFQPHRRDPGLRGKRGNSESSTSNLEPLLSVVVGAKRQKSTDLLSESPAPAYQVMGAAWPRCSVPFFVANSQMLETRLKIAFAGLGGSEARERDFLLREEFGRSRHPWPGRNLENLILWSMWKFRRLDLDGNGVTLEDIRDVMTIIKARRPYRGGELRFFDLDGNGSITENEIKRVLKYTAATSQSEDTEARAQTQFYNILKFDADGDGIILLSELPSESPKKTGGLKRQKLEDHRLRLQGVVRVFDENDDGVVTESEFLNQLKEAFRFYDKDGNGIADDFD